MKSLSENQVKVLRWVIPAATVIILTVALEHYAWKGRGLTSASAEIEKRIWKP